MQEKITDQPCDKCGLCNTFVVVHFDTPPKHFCHLCWNAGMKEIYLNDPAVRKLIEKSFWERVKEYFRSF